VSRNNKGRANIALPITAFLRACRLFLLNRYFPLLKQFAVLAIFCGFSRVLPAPLTKAISVWYDQSREQVAMGQEQLKPGINRDKRAK
jgi:hypothetical protein